MLNITRHMFKKFNEGISYADPNEERGLAALIPGWRGFSIS